MRNISFSLTTPQFMAGTKDVTRRIGWAGVQPGTILMAVEKAQGLKKGETVKKLGKIQVVSVARERLRRIVDDPEYGKREVIREGFPQMTTKGFVEFFSDANKCDPHDAIVTRIEFVKLPADGAANGSS